MANYLKVLRSCTFYCTRRLKLSAYLSHYPNFMIKTRITAHLERLSAGSQNSCTSLYAKILLALINTPSALFSEFYGLNEDTRRLKLSAYLSHYPNFMIKTRITAHLERLSAGSQNSCTSLYAKILRFFDDILCATNAF
ncbi:MAG: hypothetical protein IJ870_06610 [Alphaproteobacteria bacterium]|nr:hypothetical protein [Alphaproteobacteria bacterium]